MKNYEYFKTFKSESADGLASNVDIRKAAKKEFLLYEQNLKNVPHTILPSAPELFEKTVAACEQIAEEFSGTIKATIDYTFFTATIELRMCYVEFMRGEFMGTLQQISHHALSVCFTPHTSGDLHVEIRMPYFVAAQGPENPPEQT